MSRYCSLTSEYDPPTTEQKMELTLHQTIEKESHKTYGQVNRMWPDEIPPITKEEAFKAYKLLTRKFGSKKVWSEYYNKWETKKLYIGRRRPRRSIIEGEQLIFFV